MQTMQTMHKHAHLIAEWIKDTSKPVETLSNNKWIEVDPLWDETEQYRFKQEDIVCYAYASYEYWLKIYSDPKLSNLKLTFDPHSKKLISAELI